MQRTASARFGQIGVAVRRRCITQRRTTSSLDTSVPTGPVQKISIAGRSDGGVAVAQRGVPPQQVAEWAEHSVHMLLKVYAKCLDGTQDAARARLPPVTTGRQSRSGPASVIAENRA